MYNSTEMSASHKYKLLAEHDHTDGEHTDRELKPTLYYQCPYSPDHYAMQVPEPSSPGFIFELQDPNVHPTTSYVAILCPTDSRGCRSIIQLFCRKDPKSVMNRRFSEQEYKHLADATEELAAAYRKVFPIVQIVSGNIAYGLHPDGRTMLGTADEPYMQKVLALFAVLYSQVIARGDPKTCYVPGVPLGCPEPGELFDIHQKVPWVEGAMAKCAKHLEGRLGK